MQSGNRILVIKLGALGDVVLASAHIRRIVEAFPDASVTLLTSPACGKLLQGLPGLEVVAFRRRGVVEMWRVLAWVRRSRFAVVFDLQGSLRSRIMTRVSGACRRIGREPGFAYTHALSAGGDRKHAFDELNDLLASQDIDAADPQAWLSVPEDAHTWLDAWLDNHDLQSSKLVLMHAGSSRRWLSKRWEAVHYAGLAQALERRGYKVIWIGGDEDTDINRHLAKHAGIDATSQFSFTRLAVLGRRASFAVVNDSAPMHVLAATGLPVYAFFGPTDWEHSHAPGQAQHVMRNAVDCSPCFLRACPQERKHACLHDITPAMVIACLERDGRLQGTAVP
ncbi:MAG: glycosyltransferase family 9 protein [Gammaproteobacteria bacterium]|nr:glycosyltransferase family 9 protein [Gammaproteobacteria bacterium]